MKDVYYAADDYDQRSLMDMISNIKEDRTDLDLLFGCLLFGCLLDWGLPLSMPYQSEQIDGCTVHTYNDGDLIACFDKNIPENVVKEIAKRKPLRAVFRDCAPSFPIPCDILVFVRRGFSKFDYARLREKFARAAEKIISDAQNRK